MTTTNLSARGLDYLVERFEALGREALAHQDDMAHKAQNHPSEGMRAVFAKEALRAEGMARAFDIASAAAAGSR